MNPELQPQIERVRAALVDAAAAAYEDAAMRGLCGEGAFEVAGVLIPQNAVTQHRRTF